MPEATATRKDSPWPPALAAAALLVFGPQLLPVLTGAVGDAGGAYWRNFCVMPGVLAGAFVPQASAMVQLLVSGLATGAIFLLVAQSWRAFNRKGRVVLALLCVAGFAAHAYAFTNALRA